MPRGRLLLWALLIPVAYAPAFVTGERPAPMAAAAIVACIVAAILIAWWAGRGALDRVAASCDRVAPWVLVAAMAGYVAWACAWSRAALHAFADDNQAGLFAQSFWTLLHGHAFANTHETLDGTLGSHFGVHFSPTLLLIAPFYKLWPEPGLLLAAQALAIALVPLPLYCVLRPRVGAGAACALALSILVLPPFAWAGVRDFRDANFLPVLLLATLWALDRGRRGWFIAFALLALGVREEMGLAFVLLGLYALLSGKGARVGLAVAALGIVWFVVVVKAVMPAFWSPGLWIDPQRFFVDVLGQWGDSPTKALRSMLTHPVDVARAVVSRESAYYVYGLLRPLLFLPPLGDWAAIVAVPGFALNLLSRLGFMRTEPAYSMVPLTFLFVATTRSAARLVGRVPEASRRGAALGVALVVLLGAVPARVLSPRPAMAPSPPIEATRRVLALVPTHAPVYAPVALYSPLCNRREFGCWYSTYEAGRAPAFRGRYAWIILWPAADPPGQVRDAALADSLALDARFVRRPGFEPFIVFERR